MISIAETILPSGDQWNATIRGARNPMNSWNKMDSRWQDGDYVIGENDLDLMRRLSKAGKDHRKYLRMLTVYTDITAPLYWWSEYDTYKVGTVANSCSKMHKIHSRDLTTADFSYESFSEDEIKVLNNILEIVNKNRQMFLETKDKEYWLRMIQMIPESYNQKRTVMLSYEVLANMYHSRANHKLQEWRDFCSWIESLPHSELITGGIK